MLIKSIFIKRGVFYKKVEFDDTVNLIYSKKNSVGKTTLLRLMIYSLGYSIPSTKGINFDSCEIETEIEIDKGIMKIIRNGNILESIFNDEKHTYLLPNESYIFHSIIFNTKNTDLIENMLGAFYVDQEKGWTLLNRGSVIGKNHFNIEALVRGLSDRDCSQLFFELKMAERQLSKYQNMFNVAKYQKDINELKENIIYDNLDEQMENEITVLQFDCKQINDELSRVNNVIGENKNFKNYIEKMKLMVKSSYGEEVPVNKDTIVGFNDNFEFLFAKKKFLMIDLLKLKSKIDIIKNNLKKEEGIVKVETIIQSFDTDISKINVDEKAVNNVIVRLSKEIQRLRKVISEETKFNNTVISDIHKVIEMYAKELNLEKYTRANTDYIFTSDLKSLSGTILHKIVFIFKLAYIVAIEKKIGVQLPIILDSPSGREVDQINIDDMMNILNRDFADNQIIIASINEYKFDKTKVILLTDVLLDKQIGNS